MNLSQNPPQVGRQTDPLSVRLPGEPSHFFSGEWSMDMMRREDHSRAKAAVGV